MKQDTPEHPKMYALAERLNIPHGQAVGTMEMLWLFTAKAAQAGDIGKWSNHHIARAVHWEGDPDDLIQAMVDARWLDTHPDHGLIVHDWSEHCTHQVNYYLATRRKLFADGRRPNLKKFSEGAQEQILHDYEAGTEPGQARAAADLDNPPFPDHWKEWWYHLWPVKQNRLRVLRAWCRAVHTEETANAVLHGTRIHLQAGGILTRAPRYIPSGQKFLRDRRWEDAYLPTEKDLENHVVEREPTDEDVLRGLE